MLEPFDIFNLYVLLLKEAIFFLFIMALLLTLIKLISGNNNMTSFKYL
jgi:hypothetical protein